MVFLSPHSGCYHQPMLAVEQPFLWETAGRSEGPGAGVPDLRPQARQGMYGAVGPSRLCNQTSGVQAWLTGSGQVT